MFKNLKPSTPTDEAVRSVINYLVDNKQMPSAVSLARKLGWSSTNAIDHFRKGTRAFPKAKLEKAITVFTTEFGVSSTYLRTNTGKMWVGKPFKYDTNTASLFDVSPPGEQMLREQLQELRQKNDELQQRLLEAERRIATLQKANNERKAPKKTGR